MTRDEVKRTLTSMAATVPEGEPDTESGEWREFTSAICTLMCELDALVIPPIDLDDAVLSEVASRFQLLNGEWAPIITRLDNRVGRLKKLIAHKAPNEVVLGEIGLINKALLMVVDKSKYEVP